MSIEEICCVTVGRNPGAMQQKVVDLIGKDVFLKGHALGKTCLMSTFLELEEPTHADCLRALSRILRRLLPTMSSSPGCMVMGRIRSWFVVGRPMPRGAEGVLMRARTPLIFSLVCTSIRGSPARSCWLH